MENSGSSGLEVAENNWPFVGTLIDSEFKLNEFRSISIKTNIKIDTRR